MGPSTIGFLSFRVIFHFHEYGRKGKIFSMTISKGEENDFGLRDKLFRKILMWRKKSYQTKKVTLQETSISHQTGKPENHLTSKVSADWDIEYVIVPSRVTSIDPKTRSSESPASPSSPQFPPPKNLVATQQRGKGASTQRLPLERLFRSFLSSTRFSGRSKPKIDGVFRWSFFENDYVVDI